MEPETPELNLRRERPKEKAKGEDHLSEDELVERIAVLKESEASIRAERQELEKKLRDMKQERFLSRGDESR